MTKERIAEIEKILKENAYQQVGSIIWKSFVSEPIVRELLDEIKKLVEK